jgi:hypothetical protein
MVSHLQEIISHPTKIKIHCMETTMPLNQSNPSSSGITISLTIIHPSIENPRKNTTQVTTRKPMEEIGKDRAMMY